MQGQPFPHLRGAARAAGYGVFIFQPPGGVFRRIAQVRAYGRHPRLRRSFPVEFGIHVFRFTDPVGEIRIRAAVNRRLPVLSGQGTPDNLGMAQGTPLRGINTGTFRIMNGSPDLHGIRRRSMQNNGRSRRQRQSRRYG